MIRLQASQLKEGMYVAADVTTSDGRIVLKKGSQLSSRFIRKLEVMHLDEIPVEKKGGAGGIIHKAQGEVLPEVRARVERKFEGLPTNPIVEGLIALTQKHLQEML